MSSWLYPLYDVHGNVKATLTRSGATGYSTANWKSYDVWGGERASTGSGSMFGYCGNLGHPTDPENGFIYMRARFYEPWTGRFLSEDPAKDGLNWYNYCWNDPINFQDKNGQQRTNKELWRYASSLQGSYGQIVMGLGLFTAAFRSKSAIAITYAASCLAFLVLWCGGVAANGTHGISDDLSEVGAMTALGFLFGTMALNVANSRASLLESAGNASPAMHVLGVFAAHAGLILCMLAIMDIEDTLRS